MHVDLLYLNLFMTSTADTNARDPPACSEVSISARNSPDTWKSARVTGHRVGHNEVQRGRSFQPGSYSDAVGLLRDINTPAD